MKNSLYLNIRKKAEQNRRTGATPKKPTAEMLRQEAKIKAKKAEGGYMYPDGGPGKKPPIKTPKPTIVYTDPSLFKEAEQKYQDSLDVYNLSNLVIPNITNLPKIDEKEWKRLEEKNKTVDAKTWDFDDVQYKEDKKKNQVKDFKDYMYEYPTHLSKIGNMDYDEFQKKLRAENPKYDKNFPIELNTEDIVVQLKNGVKRSYLTYDGEIIDKGYFTDDYPDGTSRDYIDNELVNIHSPNIAPIYYNYYGEDKLKEYNVHNLSSSSTGWYDASGPQPEFKTKSNERYSDYYIPTDINAVYQEPRVRPIFKPTLEKRNLRPNIDKLQYKRYTSDSDNMSIINNTQSMPTTTFIPYEGTYEKYKRGPHYPTEYRVWLPNQKMDIVSEDKFKELNENYYLQNLEEKSKGGLFVGYANGGQYLTVDGQAHRVYRNADDDIMVNHPKEDLGKWDTINLTDKSNANTIAEGVAAVKKWHRENPSYAQGGYLYPEGGDINPGKQKAAASTTSVNTRALPEGLFENIKANPIPRQPQIINIVDKRKYNPLTKGPINPNRDLVGGQFKDPIINEIIKSAYKHGVDPYTALAIGLQESRWGQTDPNIGHVLYANEDYTPGVDEMVSFIKEKEDYAKKLGYKNREHFIQAYNGLGNVYPETEQGYHGFKMKSIYGVPVPKEGINLAKNPLYGKKIINLEDSVLKVNPEIVKRVQYYKPKMDGGAINPYMYYAGGPMYYGDGGKIWKHIGAGAYALGEGMLDTLTMGATDQLTDKGFEWLTKVGNKNIDLNDPDDVKFLKTQQQIKGYGNTAAAITTAAFTGQVGSAIGQSAKGLNTAFQASDWASDDFKKWSNIGSQAIGIGAGLAGGSLDSAQSVSKLGESAAKFGAKASKYAPYANQAMGMLGNSGQPLWQQGVARQEYLNSPEYLAMQEAKNREYVNQGLSFASHGGEINNNSLTLQTGSMRNRYKTYKTKYSRGGKVQDNTEEKLEYFGMTKVPNHSGFHYENPNGGSYGGENALFEKNEIVLHAKGGPTPGPGEFVFPSEVNGQKNRPAFLELDKNGMPIPLNMTIAQFVEREAVKGSPLRKENSLGRERVDIANQQAMDMVAYYDQLDQQQAQQKQMMVGGALQYAAAGGKLNKDIIKIVEEEYAAAYGGYINPKKYKGLNMPYSSGGKLPKEVLRARVEAHMSPEQADAYVEQYAKGGSIHIKKSKRGTFTAAAKKRGKSVQEFAREVLANKGKYSSAMVKKANFARNAAGWKHAYGGPIVSNVPQPFDGPSAQNRGGMMIEYGRGGNMYAEGGPDYDPEKLKAEGYVEYNDYFYNPTTGMYVDKPTFNDARSQALKENAINRFMQPGFQVDERSIKPLATFLSGTGIEQMPINTGETTLVGGVKKPGMENIIGPDTYVEGTQYLRPRLTYNEGISSYPGKYNLQYIDPYTLGDNEMMDERYPILDREGNIQTTPEDFARLQSVGSASDNRNKYFTNQYNQVQSTRDKVRKAYESQFSKSNQPTSQPVEPLERMQSINLQKLPTDEMPGLIPNNYPESSYRPATLTPEEQDMLNKMSNTAGFIPNDVISGKLGNFTTPYAYEEVMPKDVPTEQIARFTPPGGSDMIEDLPGFTPTQTKVSDEAIGQSYLGTAANPNLPKLTFTQSDATKYGLNPNDVNIIEDPKVKSPKEKGLTALDYGSGLLQAAGPLSQLYYGLKGPDDVNYERIKADKIDPTVAIILAAEEGRRAQDSAAYLMRQSAPTSGSYLSNLRNLSLQSGKQRGLQSASLRQAADVENTRMQNQVNAQNAQISMQEQIDRLQERDAARTNVTEGLSGLGSSTANMIRDYRTNQVNQIIAKNIGTNNYKYDPVNQTITYADQNGKMITVPAQTVIGTNPANIATGQMEQSQQLPFDPNFKFKRTNKYLQPDKP